VTQTATGLHSGQHVFDGACRRSAIPSLSAAVTVVALDDAQAVYDEAGGRLIMLNPGASAVWERCDARSTVEEIATDIARAHAVGKDEALEDVWWTLGKLAVLGLVADASRS
jgi:hypothetical protein